MLVDPRLTRSVYLVDLPPTTFFLTNVLICGQPRTLVAKAVEKVRKRARTAMVKGIFIFGKLLGRCDFRKSMSLSGGGHGWMSQVTMEVSSLMPNFLRCFFSLKDDKRWTESAACRIHS
jgi:hypothetical protein